MSNASLKEQLAAVASKLSENTVTEAKKQKQVHPIIEQRSKLKPRWLDYVQYGVELLKVYFPMSFKTSAEVKPLKKGIKQDLVKRLSTIQSIVTEDKACMVKSLAYYVNTMSYHKNVIEGEVRLDLDGNPAGCVTSKEAKYSSDKFQEKLAAKKNALQQNKKK